MGGIPGKLGIFPGIPVGKLGIPVGKLGIPVGKLGIPVGILGIPVGIPLGNPVGIPSGKLKLENPPGIYSVIICWLGMLKFPGLKLGMLKLLGLKPLT